MYKTRINGFQIFTAYNNFAYSILTQDTWCVGGLNWFCFVLIFFSSLSLETFFLCACCCWSSHYFGAICFFFFCVLCALGTVSNDIQQHQFWQWIIWKTWNMNEIFIHFRSHDIHFDLWLCQLTWFILWLRSSLGLKSFNEL